MDPWDENLKNSIILARKNGIEVEFREVDFLRKMGKNLKVMQNAAEYGLKNKVKSISGLIGGDAYILNNYCGEGKSLTGNFIVKAMARALSCSEVNVAMAAGAVVEMMGGTPEQALNASAIVIKNVLGLVCDPVAGLVEIPCAKRNVSGTVSALTTADMVMAGVYSRIPFDDTVSAMYKVGKQLPCALRETALGGLAVTETGLKLKKQVLGK